MTTTHLPDGQTASDTQGSLAGGEPNIHTGQRSADTQLILAGVGQSPVNAGQAIVGAHTSRAGVDGPHVPDGQWQFDTHTPRAIGDPNIHTGHLQGDPHLTSAGVEQSPPAPANAPSTPKGETPGLADPVLRLSADIVDDLERVRIANENRLRQMTRTATDDDGERRGFGLPQWHPDVIQLEALLAGLIKIEEQATKNLERRMKQHPLGPWVKRTSGVGAKQAARLLAAIGDPYWNTLHDRPRLVSELWAYCGYHVEGGSAVTRSRGKQANWSPTAKMRTYLVSVSCIKTASSPYRVVYDEARAKYADAVHQQECKRCGPAGKPAAPGSPLSAGHQHARALRAMSKALLADLWREARALHGVDA